MKKYTIKFMRENRVFTAKDMENARRMIGAYWYSPPEAYDIDDNGNVHNKSGQLTSLVVRPYRGGFIGFHDMELRQPEGVTT